MISRRTRITVLGRRTTVTISAISVLSAVRYFVRLQRRLPPRRALAAKEAGPLFFGPSAIAENFECAATDESAGEVHFLGRLRDDSARHVGRGHSERRHRALRCLLNGLDARDVLDLRKHSLRHVKCDDFRKRVVDDFISAVGRFTFTTKDERREAVGIAKVDGGRARAGVDFNLLASAGDFAVFDREFRA